MELEDLLAQVTKERDEWRLQFGKLRALLEKVQHLPGFKEIVDDVSS